MDGFSIDVDTSDVEEFLNTLNEKAESLEKGQQIKVNEDASDEEIEHAKVNAIRKHLGLE